LGRDTGSPSRATQQRRTDAGRAEPTGGDEERQDDLALDLGVRSQKLGDMRAADLTAEQREAVQSERRPPQRHRSCRRGKEDEAEHDQDETIAA
jgi:hypothetical protein